MIALLYPSDILTFIDYSFFNRSLISDQWTNWGSWIRTNEWRNQNPLPYRLAIPQYTIKSGYRDLNSGPLAPKASALAKLSHTPKWNGFVLLLPSASTFIEGISRDLAPVYYPPYGHSSSFCGTLLQGLSTTCVSHLPFLILYKYYNKIFIKNQLNNFAIFLLVATPTY